MSYETQKANRRRKKAFLCKERVFVGRGIDLGSGKDPFKKNGFRKISSIEPFDIEDGDAQYVNKYRQENSYDFVYSSNCLEHMEDPSVALKNWMALVKEGGHLFFTVPDEDLYEQKVFPSRFNPDHKWIFTISKEKSWSPKSINILDLIKTLDNFKIIKIELVDTDYDYFAPTGKDQTKGKKGAEAFIEVVLQKTKNRIP